MATEFSSGTDAGGAAPRDGSIDPGLRDRGRRRSHTSRYGRAAGGAAAAALTIIGGVTAVRAATADAHGSVASPPSRAYQCRFDTRDNAMCAQAWQANPQALYDWMEVNIADAAGRHRELIPDGRLCSAGRDKYAALDTPGAWPTTPVVRDAQGRTHLAFEATAPHATLYYRWYLTREGYDPDVALRWDDLELVHDSGPRPAEARYEADVALPARTGDHVLYLIWQRSDSPEAFYSCSDVSFSAAPTTTAPATTAAPVDTTAATATTADPAASTTTAGPTATAPTTAPPVSAPSGTPTTTSSASTTPTTTATTASTTPVTTGATVPTSTAPANSVSTSTVPTSTIPTSTVPTSTAPATTAPTGTIPTSTTVRSGTAGAGWQRGEVLRRCRWWLFRWFQYHHAPRPGGAPGSAASSTTRPPAATTTTAATTQTTSRPTTSTAATPPSTTVAPTTTRATTATTAATSTTRPPSTTVPPSSAQLSEAERFSLQFLNDERAKVGLPPLRAAADLSANARAWAQNMRNTGFRHSTNADLAPFITGTRSGWGENIVWWSDPNQTPQQAAARFNELWRNSPGHYRNMTSTGWTEVGVGIYHDSSGWWGVHQFSNGR